eukprot:5904144-Lingulodinium_polyedra.AAC.1
MCPGCSVQTPAGARGLKVIATKGELLFPTFCVNDCATEPSSDNVHGWRHLTPDCLACASG